MDTSKSNSAYETNNDFLNTKEITFHGYTISQINGCRILERIGHEEPEKGSEVYVSNIPDDVYENRLFPIFNSIGTVHRLRLMVCFSGSTKGYGYVLYANPRLAAIAIRTINNYRIDNNNIYVSKSRDNCRLYFGNIPKDKSRHDIEIEFYERMNDIKEIFFYTNSSEPNKNRGFVFVEFSSHRSAAIARRKCANKLFLWGKKINVDWADDEEDIADDYLFQLTDLYVRCIPAFVTEDDLKIGIKRALYPKVRFQVKKIKDFAFLHFDNHETAESVLSILKGLIIKDYKLNITWANPNKKSKHERMTKLLVANDNNLPSMSQELQSLHVQANRNDTEETLLQVNKSPASLSSTMYRTAYTILQQCGYKLFYALSVFAKFLNWGNIQCVVNFDYSHDLVLYDAVLKVPDAPIAIQLMFLSLDTYKAKTEMLAREIKACLAWKLILPEILLPDIETCVSTTVYRQQ